MNELDLFTEALSRIDAAERAAFLDQACAGNPELRCRLEELLAAFARGGSPFDRLTDALGGIGATVEVPATFSTAEYLSEGATDAFDNRHPDVTSALESEGSAPSASVPAQRGPDEGAATLDQFDSGAAAAAEPAVSAPRAGTVALDERVGTIIAGRYKLVEVIGEGGMGTVYLASQIEPVKRQVALKLIKSGMDSRGVLARFDVERQALAMMDHPNIARIYDGGLTATGQPFFVMELMRGVPLTQYCDQKRLSVKARLELFVGVCQAVQHAHQKGIIHRDLKPGNVLVTEVDGRPTPKVIDFGVAKATERNLMEMSLSDTGAIVGTPTYMSPEQADPSSMDIDTRTDVYALGVILYELLVGSPPLEAKDFKRGAVLEMLRMVREVDPPRPSTKLSTAEALPNIAANRSIEPARLAKLFQGELDWVVMKALEKDRSRRYETANGFARDIERYLADEVVEARPPSRVYRLKKFVKRNKIEVIAVSLVLSALLAGIMGTTIGLFEAQKQERLAVAAAVAEKAAKLDAVARRQEAERNLAFARKGNEILGSVFAGLEPKKIAESGRPLQDVLRENLVKAVKELEGSAIGDPLEVAAIQSTLGQSLNGLGEYDLAVEVLEKAGTTRKAKLGPDHPDTLTTMNNLAQGYRYAGKLDKALPLFDETLAMRKAKLGPDHPDTLTTMNNLAVGYEYAGKLDKALPLKEEVLALRKAKLGPDHPDTLTTMNNLALGYQAAGKLDRALPLLVETLELMKAKLGLDHPNTLTAMNNLALGYKAAGKLDKALPLLEETLALRKSKLGPDHPESLTSIGNLAEGYRGAGKLDKALPLYEESLSLMRGKLGPDHPDTVTSMNNLALGYKAAGKLDKAVPLLEETLALRKAKHGADHPDTLIAMNNLAAGYWSMKRLDKSVPLFETALKLQETKLGRDHLGTLFTVANLGVNYKDAGRLAEAIPLLEEAYQAAKKRPTLRWVGGQLIDAYMKAGENAKLVELLQEQLAEARKTQPKNSPQLAGLLAQIGLGLLEQKKWAEAEPLLRECLAIRENTQPDVWSTFNARSLVGGALLGQKKYTEAEPLLLAGYEGMKQRENTIPPEANSRIPGVLDRLIELATAANKSNDVKKWQAERAKYPNAAPPPGEKK